MIGLHPAPSSAATDPGVPPDPASQPLRVCIVAHMAYGAFFGGGGHIGGVEHQTTLLARFLAGRGHAVSLVTWDEGQRFGTVTNGVTLYPMCKESDGWPLLRFFHPRWSSLRHALRAAKADVYYQNCAEQITGQVALWCRVARRRFVFSTASNADCDARLPFLATRRERTLYRIGLRLADRVIAQTEQQQAMLATQFGRESTVIPLPCPDLRASVDDEPANPRGRRRVLWIGRVSIDKRPDHFVELAVSCPEIDFELIGPVDGSGFAATVLTAAARLPNLQVTGPLTRAAIAARLSNALCVCNTSPVEGFPNTFLEAWSTQVPVVSIYDPGGIIAARGLGWTEPTVEALASRVRWLAEHPALGVEAGRRARRYYEAHHRAERVLPRFERLLREVVAVPR